jgi:ISXO2-like transposase domain
LISDTIVSIIRVTLTGYRFIGSRDGLGDSRGRLHFQRVAKSRAAFTPASPLLPKETRCGERRLKRGILGTWHRIFAKRLPAYLDEMTWRFNNRKNPFLFRDTMLKLIHSDNLEYTELTRAA